MSANEPSTIPEPAATGSGADEQPRQQRVAIRALLFPAYFVIAFSLCYISAFHSPVPHRVPVAVVGPAVQTAQLRAGLQHGVGSKFEVQSVSTVADATREVRNRDLFGAYVPPASANQTATVIVSGVSGSALASAVESLFRPVAAQQGAQLVVDDVHPLPAGDATGTASFYFLILCTLGGYLTVTVLGQAAPALRPRRRYPLIAAAAIATPIILYLIGGLLFGAYQGSVGTIFALIGVGALYALIVGVLARALQVALGESAIIAMMAVFVFLNFPSSGGAIPAQMLPAFWRFIHSFWIGAPAYEAMRSILYFHGAGVGTDLVKLGAWLVIVIALLQLPISRKLERERERQNVGQLERAAAQAPPT